MPTSGKTATNLKNRKIKTTAGKEKVSIGDRVPSFSLPIFPYGKISSMVLKGKCFLLYFYPKDDTSGCTAEACAFSAALPEFKKMGITIIGVSKDTVASHEKFSQKYKLNFILASDSDTDVCEKFGVWKEKSMYGRSYMGIERSTFLIDKKGYVRHVWRKVRVPGHVQEVRKVIEDL